MMRRDSRGLSARGAGAGGRRRVLRGGAAGAAVAVTAVLGLGGAGAAVAAPAPLPVPVPCNAAGLAAAITGAPSGAILSLASGCHYAVTGALPTVTSTLTLQGNGATIARSGAAHFTALTVSDAELIINQLTMSGFDSDNVDFPGALDNDGGHVTITNSRFANNGSITDYGGAIVNDGQLRVTTTAFTDNEAKYGGAVANNSGSSVLVSDNFADSTAYYGGAVYADGGTVTVSGSSRFTGNASVDDYGGAIYNEAGTVNVTGAKFTDNTSTDYGGAIYEGDGTDTVADSSFTGNTAYDGGAVYADADLVILSGDTITDNHGYDGGAIYVYEDTVNLTKTVVFGNHADDEGGGIYAYALESPTVNLGAGTIVTGNHPDNCYGLSC
jgi:predicted outer membrane repeat protein